MKGTLEMNQFNIFVVRIWTWKIEGVDHSRVWLLAERGLSESSPTWCGLWSSQGFPMGGDNPKSSAVTRGGCPIVEPPTEHMAGQVPEHGSGLSRF